MAHSTVRNAGQAYASARKHRTVTGEELARLRLTAFGRKRSSDEESANEERTRANALVEAANRAQQSRSSYSHYY